MNRGISLCLGAGAVVLACATLADQGQQPVLVRDIKVKDPVYSMALSPDGKTLATVLEMPRSRSKEIALWDAETGEMKRALGEESRGSLAVCFSPDGKKFVGGSEGNTVRVWDTDTAQLKQTFIATGHTGRVHSFAFSPDGKQLATAGFEDDTDLDYFGGVMVWDSTTGALMFTIEQRDMLQVNSVSFSPDGQTLATGACAQRGEAKQTGDVTLWSAKSGALLRSLGVQTEPVQSVAFAPDGRTLAATSRKPAGDVVQLFECNTGKVLRTMTGHTGLVWQVAFSPDGKLLASAGWRSETEGGGGEVLLWDAATQALAARLTGHERVATSIAFSPDSKTLWTGSRDATVKLWRLR